MRGSSATWDKVRIEAIQAPEKYALNGGPFGSKLVSSMYVPEGVPVIRGVNLPLEARFSLAGLVFVSEKTAAELAANTARPGDVIFTQRGTLGQVGIIPRASPYSRFIISQSQMKLTVDPRQADTSFIYYTFRAPETVARVTALASSSGVPHINLDTLRKFEIVLPSLSIQRRIASILSAYDDLIENNIRRIAILEEVARRLYEEWFVSFRFPGLRKQPSNGCLPDGWQVLTLGEVCDRITDGAHKSPPSVEAGRPMASVKDMHDWGLNLRTCRHISQIDFDELVRNHCQPRHNDILIAKDGANLNKHTFLVTEDVDVVLLSSIAILRPGPKVDPEFLVAQLKAPHVNALIKQSKSGAAIPRIILRDFARLPILVPPVAVQSKWRDTAGPIASLCRSLVKRNSNLEQQRDLLLPKLMSGEIDMPERVTNAEAAE